MSIVASFAVTLVSWYVKSVKLKFNTIVTVCSDSWARLRHDNEYSPYFVSSAGRSESLVCTTYGIDCFA